MSSFQRFIWESTGTYVSVYGQDFFDKPQAYQIDAAAPVTAGHIVGPGDEIQLQIWGGVNFNGSLVVDRNGQVSIPGVGVVPVAGVTAGKVQDEVRNYVARTYNNFDLSASMGRLQGIQVYMVGAANQPGSLSLPSGSTLVNAIFASGGPNENGSMRAIQVKRNGQVIRTLDLYEFISTGNKQGDIGLLAGDVIVIPPAGPRVAVLGQTDGQAIYELKAGSSHTSIEDLLKIKGGIPVLARSGKAVLERMGHGDGSQRKVEEVNLLNAASSTMLQDGDILTLLEKSQGFDNAVTLQGNVAEPMRYSWRPGMRIRDLIPDAQALITPDYFKKKNSLVQQDSRSEELLRNYQFNQQNQFGGRNENYAVGANGFENKTELNSSYARNYDSARGQSPYSSRNREADSSAQLNERVRSMVDQVNWDYAVIERLDKEKLKTQLISFNLGLAVLRGDESQNLELQPGDVVTILSQKDLEIPLERQTRLVRVEGEVAAPGLYELQPGETLNQLLMRIGGVTPQAYLYGLALQRESVRKRQQENLDLVIQRLESQQQSQMLHMVANRSAVDMGAQALVMKQQQELLQSQLQNLRELKSNGRITLELDAKNVSLNQLPELPLEDGDHIKVPAIPGFVSVAGAVNNENVFIYKQGRSVSDVLKVAGLREEADREQAFVLRADGSIVSESSMGMLGSLQRVELMPGDTVIVPEKLDRETTRNFVMRQLKDVTQILSQFGLGVAAIKVMRDF